MCSWELLEGSVRLRKAARMATHRRLSDASRTSPSVLGMSGLPRMRKYRGGGVGAGDLPREQWMRRDWGPSCLPL